ncbi:CAP domain-containing protein [Hydrogenophaga sp.]|uniref:CAP domain-containing protein n=1 Tax=Hydrogenophaga sp. TaxID=1904254 RepID=UPI002617F5A9|nr:CAP domain-containing protein [Hydrogenophaga sp.]MCW5655128.1 CAP domain-containing protein [Hydrogenophaga sp.]
MAALLACSLVLAACGGGGSDDSTSAASTPSGTIGATPATDTGSSSGAGGSASGLVALDASTSCGLADFRNSLLQQINAARASPRTCGTTAMPAVDPLNWDDRLFSAAAKHSRDMAVNNYFSHTGLDGRTHSQRIAAEGYAWSWTGENIAAGQQTVSAVMSGWLGSAGHCANIMRAEFRDVAVSCVQQAGSTYGRYWTMVLARPQ